MIKTELNQDSDCPICIGVLGGTEKIRNAFARLFYEYCSSKRYNVKVTDVMSSDTLSKDTILELDAVVFTHDISHPLCDRECQLICDVLLPEFRDRIMILLGYPGLFPHELIFDGLGQFMRRGERIKRICDSICKNIDNLRKTILNRTIVLYGVDSPEYRNAQQMVDASSICFPKVDDKLPYEIEKILEQHVTFKHLENCKRLLVQSQRVSGKRIYIPQKRISDKVFRIGVVGEFRRGKSALIDAILGKKIIPFDVLPSPHIPTFISWGDNPRAVIHYIEESGREPLEISIDKLEDYMSLISGDSERAEKDIVIYYPSDYCKNDVEILEMPGLNDDEYTDSLFYDYLPYLDAIIFMVCPGTPLSMSEEEMLGVYLLSQFDYRSIFFVINKIDTVRGQKDREKIVENIRERIQTSIISRTEEMYGTDSLEYQESKVNVGCIRIYPVSASEVLDDLEDMEYTEAVREERSLYTESGFLDFAEALHSFINIQSELQMSNTNLFEKDRKERH